MPLNDYSRKSSKSSSLLRYNKSCIKYSEAKRCEIQERSEGLARRSVLQVVFTRERNSTRAHRACVRACTLLIAYIQRNENVYLAVSAQLFVLVYLFLVRLYALVAETRTKQTLISKYYNHLIPISFSLLE